MLMINFQYKATNLKKCPEKILFSHRSESLYFQKYFLDSLLREKSVFSGHFLSWLLSIETITTPLMAVPASSSPLCLLSPCNVAWSQKFSFELL